MLPITKYREDIVKAVRDHYVTIVSAETGSGKSTQIPQYLVDDYSQIIVTEPRIMAAKTLAKRVANEMQVDLGQEVGYKTAYDKCASVDSKIVFCTDGLQLIRSMFNQNNEQRNVLIIDEVHEWNLNIETLIAWCKFMQNKWNTKVVIMSATIDACNLADFYGDDVTVLNIPGSLYPVEVEERAEYSLIPTIVENITDNKNILVFVPGKKEISDVMDDLQEYDATVLPLHGEMDWEDQKKCFENYSNPKVVVATNVAQTSLTIPDIDVVIDTGTARISIAEDGIQGLFLKDISISDILQRKGRAGRTKEGKYYLCSNTPIDCRSEFSVPEIQRSILDRVVLQLAAIGLDAETLEFYHQPEKSAIHIAKTELSAIGALTSKNEVTELGYKICKMPVSVQLARMIVEADKYEVTKPVITIAAIVEMGGLLSKEGFYSNFTSEEESDLLAEWDVWNKINSMDFIDFRSLGIKKKNFFKIKEHIKKLKETLYGIVEFTDKKDRRAILKACLSGWVSNVFIKTFDNHFYGKDDVARQLNRNSCMFYACNNSSLNIIIGMPKTIEFKNKLGFNCKLDLISFASQIDVTTLTQLNPNAIEVKEECRYCRAEDAVEVVTKKYYSNMIIDVKNQYVLDHSRYEELKSEYEMQMMEVGYTYSYIKRQTTVEIDNKLFSIHYYGLNQPVVYLTSEELFSIQSTEVFLDNGNPIWFSMFSTSRKEKNINALRNAYEANRISNIKKRMKDEYHLLDASTLMTVLSSSDKIGKIELTKDYGGYGNNSIFSFGCITIKRNSVIFDIIDDEELANANTLEALQYLFIKEINKKYNDSRFSHQSGKKKKKLTDSELEVKEDFNSLVREIMPTLSIENVLENLEFLEEYYQDIMK